MTKEALTIYIADFCVDYADKFVKYIEFCIEHEMLDNIEARLNQHGWVKERTCTRGEEFWECSGCGLHGLHSDWRHCPECGSKVVGD